MFSLEKIQKLFNDSEDFMVQQLIIDVNFGSVDSVLKTIREFLVEKRQDDLLEIVDFYVENHCYENYNDKDVECFNDSISQYIE